MIFDGEASVVSDITQRAATGVLRKDKHCQEVHTETFPEMKEITKKQEVLNQEKTERVLATAKEK